ncbi:MAG: carboxymuconolactone decarboxylase family protein [Armatimonadetes bacterium]|jgi:hypothetical protein|nr:carboxymuconolactone decarboxylase family protein [Armatimonadota bacterium]
MRQTPLSTGADVVFTDHLTPEQPTIFFFYRPSSTMEQQYFEGIQAQLKGKPVGLQVIHLKTGEEPIAKKNEIVTTPTALIFDRRGRLTGKATNPDELMMLARQAGDVARIDWLTDPADPRFEALRKMGMPFKSPQQIPGIMRTMSLKPEAMAMVQQLAGMMHFADGALTRRQKELVATYVSALNRCKY